MLYAIYAKDKPDHLELRKTTRDAHLAYGQSFENMVLFAGPMLDDAGNMCGSLIVVEAEDKAAVERFVENDPYMQAGLFASVEIHGWKRVVG